MTNVKLSPEEFQLVTDAELILTKNRIIEKVYRLFGDLSNEYRRMDDHLSAEHITVQPKISRGENYLGLPWVMLDYPRIFSKSNVIAVRSFFWWGKFFSITLQLQGIYHRRYASTIGSHLARNRNEWFICVNDDPWQHHFDTSNYVQDNSSIEPGHLPFIKIAKKIPLQQWDNSVEFFVNNYREIVKVLGSDPVK